MEMTRRQNPAVGIPHLCHTTRAECEPNVFIWTAKIERPAMFIAGKKDPVLSFGGGGWVDLMDRFVPDLRGKVYVDGAGHWVQMERPEAVTDALLGFLAEFA